MQIPRCIWSGVTDVQVSSLDLPYYQLDKKGLYKAEWAPTMCANAALTITMKIPDFAVSFLVARVQAASHPVVGQPDTIFGVIDVGRDTWQSAMDAQGEHVH